MSHYIVLKDKIQNMILYQGTGSVEQQEKDIQIDFNQDDRHYRFIIRKDSCIMDNSNELDTHFEFEPNQTKSGWIDTPFGRIDVEIKTTLWKREIDSLEFAYHLSLQDEERPFHFKLEFREEE